MKKPNLLVVDAFSVLFRAFYSFPPTLTLADQTPINAVFGFLTLILKAIDHLKPDQLCICFDHPKPSFRKSLYTEYKANRAAAPESFLIQLPLLYTILDEIQFYYINVAGYEADDLMGTLSTQLEPACHAIYLMTSDQDCFQLVNQTVSVAISQKGMAGFNIFTPEKVLDKLGVSPQQIVDYKALRGDPSDNIPGVKGIGEKTATQLLKDFSSLENIYQNLSHISSKSVVSKLKAGESDAQLSQTLARIVTNVDLDIDLERLKYAPNWNIIQSVFKQYQFTNLLKKYAHKTNTPASSTENLEVDAQTTDNLGATIQSIPDEIKHATLITNLEDLKKILIELEKGFSIDLETTSLSGISAQIVGIAIFNGKKGYYIALNKFITDTPTSHPLSLFSSNDIVTPTKTYALNPLLAAIAPLLENSAIPKITHNGKYEALVLRQYGIQLSGISFDTMLAGYLLFPGEKMGLKDLTHRHLNYQMTSFEDIVGKGKEAKLFSDVALEDAMHYAVADVYFTWQLHTFFLPQLEEKQLMNLLTSIEIPTQNVLAEMEHTGVCIDHSFLDQLNQTFLLQSNALKRQIEAVSNEEINLNSSQQLARLLYDELNLPVLKKTKTGRSTDSSVLEKLSIHYPIAADLIQFRRIEKLRNTYISVLPQLIHPKTGRVHTQFNQTVAITGRLSSSSPNLQNIPIKTTEGKQIRKAFIPSHPEHVIVAIDYSQIELRLMAHLSGDPALIKAFKNGEDIHQATAAIIHECPIHDVSAEMRYHAKAVNFGIIYGISAFGLSENIGISRKEAQKIISDYFNQFPKIKAFIDDTINEAEKNECVSTMHGRIRPIIGINDRLFSRRTFAQRAAVNTRVQGSAADIMKLAMINTHTLLKKMSAQSKILIQVHDELVFDMPKSEIDSIIPLIKTEMETVITLDVPLTVDVEYGPNWLELNQSL